MSVANLPLAELLEGLDHAKVDVLTAQLDAVLNDHTHGEAIVAMATILGAMCDDRAMLAVSFMLFAPIAEASMAAGREAAVKAAQAAKVAADAAANTQTTSCGHA